MNGRIVACGVLLIFVGPAFYHLRISSNFMPELWWWFRIKCAIIVTLGVFFIMAGLLLDKDQGDEH